MNFVRFSDRLPDAARKVERIGAARLALDLLRDDQPFLAVDVDGERRAPVRSERWTERLDRLLDVLWVVVLTADDDQILQAAGDVQIATAQKSQIAGPQEGPPILISQSGGERVGALGGPVPAAARGRRAPGGAPPDRR